ncbi:MAG: hypothetical protein C0621_05730 [Desulfuromonas sp.]|nr:MAG: hypothetical protein C0621_05730 [Desulfuromonas sp.]
MTRSSDSIAESMRQDGIPEEAIAAWQETQAEVGCLDKVRDAARSIGSIARSGFRRATAEEQARRMGICRSCDHFTGVTCALCGCVMEIKTSFTAAGCRQRRW